MLIWVLRVFGFGFDPIGGGSNWIDFPLHNRCSSDDILTILSSFLDRLIETLCVLECWVSLCFFCCSFFSLSPAMKLSVEGYLDDSIPCSGLLHLNRSSLKEVSITSIYFSAFLNLRFPVGS